MLASPSKGLTATKDLLGLGVDTLMSLIIIWELNQLDIEFPQPSLLENRTLQDIEKMLFPNDMLPQPKRYIYR